jgi:hypothetical protein
MFRRVSASLLALVLFSGCAELDLTGAPTETTEARRVVMRSQDEARGVNENPTPVTAPAREFSEFEMRQISFTREDFPLEWTSQPVEPDDSSDDSGSLESCLGLAAGALTPYASVESDHFSPYETPFLVGSIVTAYTSEESAKADFESIDTAAGRECVRAEIRSGGGIHTEEPLDVVVEECEPLLARKSESRCLVAVLFEIIPDTGEETQTSFQIYMFRSRNVTAAAMSIVVGGYPADLPDEMWTPFASAAAKMGSRLDRVVS